VSRPSLRSVVIRLREAALVYRDPRMAAILALGFSSGLPIMLVAATLSARLAEAGVSRAAIGLFAYVLAPYTFKFAWAPLVDRMPFPPFTTLLGRRRGWMLATQIGLLVSIWLLGQTDPARDLGAVALVAFAVAFLSATQDMAIDAFRIEILERARLAAGAGVVVLGYRIGMWVATAGALVLAEWYGWSFAYMVMAALVLVGVTTVLLVREPEEPDDDPAPAARTGAGTAAGAAKGDGALAPGALLAVFWLLLVEPFALLAALFRAPDAGPAGIFLALLDLPLVLYGIAAGRALLRREAGAPGMLRNWALFAMAFVLVEVATWLSFPGGAFLPRPDARLLLAALWLLAEGAMRLFAGFGLDPDAFSDPDRVAVVGFWARFLVAVAVYALARFSGALAAACGAGFGESPLHRWVRRAVVEPFYDFFARHGVAAAVLVLALVSFFKASDVLLTLMANPFYIEMGFTKAQIAWVSKTFGLWMTLLGGLVGGAVAWRLGLLRSMVVAVVAMAGSNLAFLLLARVHDLGPAGLGLDAAGFGELMLALFHLVILVENLSGGLGTAIFVAFLSALCNVHYTAVQYALLTSFMQLFGKFVIVPASGFLADALGWQAFFVGSTLFALPALALLYALSRLGFAFDAPAPVSTASSARSPSR